MERYPGEPAGREATPADDTVTPVNKRAPRKRATAQVAQGKGSADTPPDDGLRGQKRMAARFAAGFKGKFAHTPGRGWLEFNGAYWEDCGDARPWNGVHGACNDALRELPGIGRTDWRDELYKDVRACDSAEGTRGVLKHAMHWPGIGRRDEDLDAHENLFVTRSGTLDLWAGTYRPSDPADLMTLAAGVEYDPAADCPLYDSLMALYQPDSEVRDYLHRLGGAAMEGRMNLQQLIVNYGATGGNGKGTTQRAWQHVFGTYAHTLDIGALLARKGYDQYRDDKALLKGKRLVYLTEPSEGARFDSGTVKALTGGEEVTGSQKYKSAVRFAPTWLLMMSTNTRVRTPNDGGMARRLKEVGWTYTVPRDQMRDDLDDRLRAEGPGILNRLLAGWSAYRANGIGEPESIVKATAEYLASVDPYTQFREACVVEHTGNRVPSASLYQAYVKWCDDAGEHARPLREFSPAMEATMRKSRQAGGVVWHDIAIVTTTGW